MNSPADPAEHVDGSRRRVLVAGACMTGGMLASYGTLAAMAARYLFPVDDDPNMGWQFVATLAQLEQAPTLEYVAPSGIKIVIARQQSTAPRQGASRTSESSSDAVDAPAAASASQAREELSEEQLAAQFVALSSICPHLGCAVHWEPQHDRFFCPCHNGAFDAQGRPTQGPPAAAGQSLTRYAIRIRNRSLFVWVPLRALTSEA